MVVRETPEVVDITGTAGIGRGARAQRRLHQAVSGDPSARGDFDFRAANLSLQLWPNTNRLWLAATGFGVVVGASALLARDDHANHS